MSENVVSGHRVHDSKKRFGIFKQLFCPYKLNFVRFTIFLGLSSRGLLSLTTIVVFLLPTLIELLSVFRVSFSLSSTNDQSKEIEVLRFRLFLSRKFSHDISSNFCSESRIGTVRHRPEKNGKVRQKTTFSFPSNLSRFFPLKLSSLLVNLIENFLTITMIYNT